MKLSLFAVLVALGLANASASCQSRCETNLVHFKEEACEYWRSRLPRPDLYKNCGDGYNLGRKAGCAGYCSHTPNHGHMSALRMDACSNLQRIPPIDRQEACRDGFASALDRAKAVAVLDEFVHEENDFVAPDAAGAAAPKKKVSIKKAPDVQEPKSVLEQAREEAAAAFMDAKASEL